MIHFDFVVSDADAENIMGALQTEINHLNEMVIKELMNDNDTMVLHLRESIKYFENLKLKMLNERVKNDKGNTSS